MPYDHVLKDDEKRELLRIARATLKEYFSSGRVPPGAPHRACMVQPAGVFVGLFTADGASRGSLGQPGETSPLYKAIQEMAIAAATRDPRVAAVTVEELKELIIQITVLGARRRIAGSAELVAGQEGVAVVVGPRRGQALPVPGPGQKLSPEEMLADACKKAGLAEDAWRSESAQLEAFGVQIFDEKTFPPMSAIVAVRG